VVLNRTSIYAGKRLMLNFVLSIALAGSSTVDAPPPPLPPAPPTPPPALKVGIGRYSVESGQISAEALREQFKKDLTLMDARYAEAGGRLSRPWENFDTFNDQNTWRTMVQSRPEWRFSNVENVTWIYQAPDIGSNWPSKAQRITDISDASGYNVLVTNFCAASAADCADFLANKKTTLAPKPFAGAPALALQQWHQRVATEACITRPINMSHPRYPPPALRDGIGGTVRVGFRFNTCGNVRDAWIETSSGNRDLDRAALNEVLKWQIDTTTLPDGRITGMAIAPITFRPE
jgi:TonB family protein